MTTETRERPAVRALLFYSIGLWSATYIVSPKGAALGFLSVGVLWCCVTMTGRERGALLCFFLAGGLGVGSLLVDRERGEDARLGEISPEVFATVRIQLEDGWIAREDGSWRLRSSEFEVVNDLEGYRVKRRIYVLLYDDPPAIGSGGAIVAEGFLRRLDRGVCVLSVKSDRLIRVEGRVRDLDPRRLNRYLAELLEETAGGFERASEGALLVQALVLGRSGQIPWRMIDLYQRGGTYHLLVFSGVQIALIAGFLRWVLWRVGLRRLADAALLAVCILTPRFIGSDPSVSRSALMIGFLLGARLWKRPTDSANLVFVSALVRLILEPRDLQSPGFALTYAATASILVIGRFMAQGRGKLGGALAFGLAADLGTAPFTLLFFHRATLFGSVVTLIVSPVLFAMLATGVACCFLAAIAPNLTFVLLWMIGRSNELVLEVNRIVAEDAGLSILLASPPLTLVICGSVVSLAASASGRLRGAMVGAVALAVCVGGAVVRTQMLPSEGTVVHALDVGQGDSTLLESRGKTMLVDGGGSRTDPAFGTRVLLPLLLERGAKKLDTVVMSHPHPDHCGGLATIIRDLDVGALVLSRRHVASVCGRELIDAARRRGVAIVDAEAVRGFMVGDALIDVVSTKHRYRRSWENNSSILLRIDVDGRSMLLTGDVEREAERVLVEAHEARLKADVLKVAHHGSRSSTTSRFLAAVEPRVALVSCGQRNRFGHPHPEPLSNLSRLGVRVWRTDLSGSLRIDFREGHLFTSVEFDSEPGAP